MTTVRNTGDTLAALLSPAVDPDLETKTIAALELFEMSMNHGLTFDKDSPVHKKIVELLTGLYEAALPQKPSGGEVDIEHELHCLKADYKHLETHSRSQAEEHDATKRELARANIELARMRKAARINGVTE